jgi:hypothetical protein
MALSSAQQTDSGAAFETSYLPDKRLVSVVLSEPVPLDGLEHSLRRMCEVRNSLRRSLNHGFWAPSSSRADESSRVRARDCLNP